MKKKLKANWAQQPECSDPVKEMTTTTTTTTTTNCNATTTKFSNADLWAMARGDAPYVFAEDYESDEDEDHPPPAHSLHEPHKRRARQEEHSIQVWPVRTL